MNISVIIPNFNGEKLLGKNIPQVIDVFKNYKDGAVEIIVTDDASKDNSITVMQDFIKKYSTLRLSLQLLENHTGTNKGFASNVNKGVAHATGEIVILLNTDVIPRKDFLSPMLKHFEDKNIFAVGCMDESIEEKVSILRGRGIGRWYRGFLMHSAGDVEKSNTTLWASCGSGAFRKSIWNKIGGLNELYNPFYWEDIDISYKAKKAGYEVLFERKSIVVHAHEEGAIKKNYSSYAVKKTAYRNQFFFTWLNATDTMLLVQHVLFLPYFLLQAFVHGDKAFLVGFCNALFLFPKVLVQRANVQKIVTKSDKAVVSVFKGEA